eukprot:5825111-Prymnesium_polylepis.1
MPPGETERQGVNSLAYPAHARHNPAVRALLADKGLRSTAAQHTTAQLAPASAALRAGPGWLAGGRVTRCCRATTPARCAPLGACRRGLP